ncbi:hypothetical protein PTSG_09551 [Salpingoeca rosetta]|uniref:Tc1-like transposase DDE domain-containing protein n=1 Tax=Salpingoeca rosetta (strain ATCC 50818 / BSB-021) TaxID=946362 RepID=F2ULB7_SALR5|nr:uncharacterized protein PTSG_09551 [Salpingoeca rosetta]EGD77916.1 hypothetical protein PTSG_09551 [Salpingoeca rosetta]|eukprot:XP_004989980.1 hypothetical protein PTSG_09551 [Salpingoeca rosetta]
MAQRRSATAAGSTDGTPPCVKKKEGRLYAGSLDNEEYDAFKKWLKKQRKENSRTLTVDAKLDIVAVQAYFRHEKFVHANKSGRPKQYRFTALAKNVLQRSTDVCQQAWKDYERAQAVSVADNDGPRGTKTTKFKRTEALRVKLQNWLYERTVKGNRTVAKDVLGFFCSSGVLPMYSDPTSKANALRAVQRYLESLGYERGQRGGCTTYMEKEEVLIKRDAYITQMIKARQQRRRIVYLDESYIHHHYRRHDESLYDPGDNRLLPKQKHKGRRFCFIAAIISSDPAVPEAERSEEHRAQLLPETLDIFEGGKKQSGKAQTKDYHGMFDSAYFERWMQTLLATLDARGIKNTIIVMDNAKVPQVTPSGHAQAIMEEGSHGRGLHGARPASIRHRHSGLAVGQASRTHCADSQARRRANGRGRWARGAVDTAALLRPSAHRDCLGKRERRRWSTVQLRHNVQGRAPAVGRGVCNPDTEDS